MERMVNIHRGAGLESLRTTELGLLSAFYTLPAIEGLPENASRLRGELDDAL